MSVPYPVRPRASAPWRSLPDMHERILTAPVRHVPLSKLVGYQRTVKAERVAEYAEDPSRTPELGPTHVLTGVPVDLPIVVWSGGRAHVHNGNHRSSARLQRGESLMPARVIDLDGEPDGRKFRASSVLALHRESCTEATFVPRAVEDVAEMVGDVAVICIDGPLEAKSRGSWWWGFDNYESILCRFRSAIESEEVGSILLKIDSNGGDACGLNECVDQMITLKKAIGKMVCAYADEAAYSAAFAIACVADEVYLPRSGGVGSVGVRSGIISFDEANKKAGVAIELFATGSKKLLGDPDAPITDAARARVQRRIGQLGEYFFELVAQSRDMSVRSVKKLEADVFFGEEAVGAGLADSVMSLQDVLYSMARLDTYGTRGSGSTRAQRGKDAKGSAMILAMRKAVADARAALKTAKTTREREDAADALEIAKARLGAVEGKVTKDKKTVTTIHDSESSSSESSESSMSSASESESESAAYESESESAEADDGKAARAAASLLASATDSKTKLAAGRVLAAVKSGQKLATTLMALTGKASVKSALGALEAVMQERDQLKSERKAERAERRAEKIDKLMAEGLASGKITPGKADRIKSKAVANGVEWLESYLEDANPVAGRDHEPRLDESGSVAITDDMKAVWKMQGFAEADYPRLAKEHAAKLAGKAKNGAAS